MTCILGSKQAFHNPRISHILHPQSWGNTGQIKSIKKGESREEGNKRKRGERLIEGKEKREGGERGEKQKTRADRDRGENVTKR